MASEIDSRIAGLTFATNGPLFDTITHTDTGPFTRNADFWGSDIDLTCVSPSNSERDEFMSGTAITKRHVLYCKHGGEGTGYPTDGTTMRFVAADNSIVLRTQSEHLELALPDMCIGLLDSDLPAEITPCAVAPDNLLAYINFSPAIPALALDAEEKGLVHDIDHIAARFVYTKAPTNATRLEFYEALITGDSGDPSFVIINGEPVLIGILKAVNEFMSPAGFNGVLNAGIVSVDALGGVSTGYTVTNPDLSGF